MYVEVKSVNGINTIPIESHLLSSNRKIFLTGKINTDNAIEITKELLFLNLQNNNEPIDIYINSEGGEVQSGLLIYDCMQASIVPIRTFCIGKCYSMAAILYIAGDQRYIMKNSEIMLHEPFSLLNNINAKSSNLKAMSKNLKEIENKINNILSKHTKMTLNEIKNQTKGGDHFYNAEESLKLGFTDKILDNFMEV